MKNLILFTVIFVLWVAVGANATPVTIQINGTVTSAGGIGLPDGIQSGGTFIGTYTYNSSVPDSDSSAQRGIYLHSSPYGISIVLGGYEFKTAPTHIDQFVVSIANDVVYNGTYDEYEISSNKNATLSDGSTISSIQWQLSDNTHSAFSSTDLPILAPVLNQWNYKYFAISGKDSLNESFYIDGIVTQAVLVPEPLTSVLLATGVFFLKRRR